MFVLLTEYNTPNADAPAAVSSLSVKFAKFEDSKITFRKRPFTTMFFDPHALNGLTDRLQRYTLIMNYKL